MLLKSSVDSSPFGCCFHPSPPLLRAWICLIASTTASQLDLVRASPHQLFLERPGPAPLSSPSPYQSLRHLPMLTLVDRPSPVSRLGVCWGGMSAGGGDRCRFALSPEECAFLQDNLLILSFRQDGREIAVGTMSCPLRVRLLVSSCTQDEIC